MPFQQTAYGWLLLAAIAASLFTWTRLARRDHRLVLIYVAALLSAFIGAKLVYVLAEGRLTCYCSEIEACAQFFPTPQ